MGRNKIKDNQEQTVVARVNQDLIVHNMPSQLNPASTSSSRPLAAGTSEFKADSPKKNFQMVGLLIIIGGIVVIGSLAYLSYRFIIKPASSTKLSVPPAANLKKDNISSSTPTATTTLIATATAPISVIDVNPASSTASLASSSLSIVASSSEPLLDSDNDGLFDEEEAILGTSATSSDTNGNSYPDLVEINNNYNPAGSGSLNTNPNLTVHHDAAYNYDISYPKAWPVKALNDEATVIFSAPDDSLIQVSVQDNPERQSILNWYETSFPNVVITYDKIKSTDNWEGIIGEDNLNFYLIDKKRQNIYVISYIPAVEERMAYPGIFKLMINSLSIK